MDPRLLKIVASNIDEVPQELRAPKRYFRWMSAEWSIGPNLRD